MDLRTLRSMPTAVADALMAKGCDLEDFPFLVVLYYFVSSSKSSLVVIWAFLLFLFSLIL